MATLRERLRDASPRVPLKAAWRAQIQAARAAGRVRGAPLLVSSRPSVEQSLDQAVAPGADVTGLKDALGRLLAAEGEDRLRVAVEIDARVRAMIATVATAPLPLVLSGWPSWLTMDDQSRILGRSVQDLGTVEPEEAAALIRELDGLHLGGSRLMAQARLPPGERLPAVPRDRRTRPRARGTRPWLPFLDEQGRYSLTPEALAEEHAKLLAEHGAVIDAFCGCGGDAIAFAQAGLDVHAIEHAPTRIALAEKNAVAKGVDARIRFHCGEAQEILPRLIRALPRAAVYLDPPWGGVDWERSRWTWDALVPPGLAGPLMHVPQVLLKAPRSMDPTSLPDLGTDWHIRPAWNPGPASPGEKVLFLRALARPGGSGGIATPQHG